MLESLDTAETSPKYCKIVGEKEWWDSLKWHDSKWSRMTQPTFEELRTDEDFMDQLVRDIYSPMDFDSEWSRMTQPAFDELRTDDDFMDQLVRDIYLPMDFDFDKPGCQLIFRRNDVDKRTVMIPAPQMGDTEIPPEDGFTWRKYGQKEILGSKFPRSYYRCTYSILYDCPAKKQVQRLDNNPFTFQVTYRGDHTCQMSSTVPSASPASAELKLPPPAMTQQLATTTASPPLSPPLPSPPLSPPPPTTMRLHHRPPQSLSAGRGCRGRV
ncbi:hypothetical protein RHSIM_RhsimUnG0083000 [Rhododendron simsii]|uniref:WRKY domain-containing protein n=1 Tax=Rhododendron simsii TaxID=118357 RepID=A0A834FVQ1_RHOSS|nr:hypothetical protein RHSIM_RhsimUnG0083000 [Rhododendron simsii]